MTEMEVIKTWKQFENEPSVYRTIQAFAREIQRMTREECARKCDEKANGCNHTWTILVAKSCAKSIRAMENGK